MKKAGELLESFFDSNMANSAREYSKFFSGWKKIVGEHLAAHSRIIELERTILIVEADHPGWIQLIQLRRTEILDSIRKIFPDLSVTTISIRLKKDTIPPTEPIFERRREEAPDTKVEAKPSESEKTTENGVNDPYDRIEDESFKNLLKRLENSIKERNGSRGSR